MSFIANVIIVKHLTEMELITDVNLTNVGESGNNISNNANAVNYFHNAALIIIHRFTTGNNFNNYLE